MDLANGSPRADLGHSVASQPGHGRACLPARLAMTVQSGERGQLGRAISPTGSSESNQARWPADLLVRTAGLASAAGRIDSPCSNPAGPDRTA
jgi:hypothetical protein